MRSTLIGSVLVWMLWAFPVTASNVKWHPSLPLRLGGNLDPMDITNGKSPCLTIVDVKRLENAAPSTVFTGSIIRDKQQLYNLFSVSASASARFGLGSAAASVQRLNEVSFDSETINWAISATSDFGRYGVVAAPALTASYSSRPRNEVEIECGTAYVMQERREAAIVAIFSFKSSSRRSRDDLQAALNASWSGGKFSTHVASQLRKSLQSMSVRFTLLAKGGDGLSSTSGLVATFDDFDRAREQVAAYMGTMTADKAPPAEYITASIPGFSSPGPPSAQEQALSDIWIDYVEAERMSGEADAKLSDVGSYWYFDRRLLSGALRTIGQEARRRMGELREAATQCKANVDRCMFSPDPTFTSVSWPSIDVTTRSASSECQRTACSATLDVVIRTDGPPGVGQPTTSAMALQTSQPVNSDCQPSTGEGASIGFRCKLTYPANMQDLDAVRFKVDNAVTGKSAARMLLVELYPNIAR